MKTKLDSNKATFASRSVCQLFLCFVCMTKVIILPPETVIIIFTGKASAFYKSGEKAKNCNGALNHSWFLEKWRKNSIEKMSLPLLIIMVVMSWLATSEECQNKL